MNFIYEQLAKPLIRRIGTASAVLVNSLGAPAGDVEAVSQAVITIGLVAVDLAFSYKNRKRG